MTGFPNVVPDARFVPWHEVNGRPHVVVDGPANPASVLGLSHWPDGGVPGALAADSSAEIVVRYLLSDRTGPDVAIVTNNHYDEDGLLAAWLLLHRPPAESWPLAVAAAEAGDFRTWSEPRDAWAALTMMAAAERATTPFPDVLRALNRTGGHDPAGAITDALMPHVGAMLHEPERFRRLWEPAWARVEHDRETLDREPDMVREIPGADLALVRSAQMLDPLAVFREIDAMRVLWVVDGGWIRLEHRYETWVRYVSRELPPRRDLTPVAAALNRLESAPGRWVFEGVATPAGRLMFVDANGRQTPTGLEPDVVVDAIAAHGE